MRFVVLGAPTSAGAYGVGQEQAPRALRDAGLIGALQARGIDVEDGGDVDGAIFTPDPTRRRAQNVDSVVVVAGHVRDAVRRVAHDGVVPIVVGGDCTITLGVVAGLLDSDPDVRLAYFDGDLDLSTPETTRSGILDAMGIAHMLGLPGAAPELATLGSRQPLLDGAAIALVGYEASDVDEREQAILAEHAVNHFPAEQVRNSPGGTAQGALDAIGPGSLVVHFDIDAVDSIDLPLAHYPHFNTGVTLDTAEECLAQLLASPRLAAVTLTEINPLHDPQRTYIKRLVTALARSFESRPERRG